MTSSITHRATTCLLLAAAVAATLLPANLARGGKVVATPAPYAITDLGSPRYRNWSIYWQRAYGINEPDEHNLIDIVGWDDKGSATWEVTALGGVIRRNNLATDVRLTAINDDGLSVGTVGDRLFANVPDVGLVELPGSTGFTPAAVNNLGHVVAQHRISGPPDIGTGAMWAIAPDGRVSGPFDLDTFRPLDINDSDEMAGLQDSVAAIGWFEAGILHVSKLPGLFPGNIGVATAINDSGAVVGYSSSMLLDSGTLSPFLWTADEGLKDLGSLGVDGVATDINDAGQIVGWSYIKSKPFNEQHAFLWENDKMSDLNGKVDADASRTLQSADSINDAGHIVGSGYTMKGQTFTLKTFLLTRRR